MRTDEEIVDRINAIKHEDMFGFETGDLVTVLPFDKAKPWLKEEAKPEDWDPDARDEAAVKTRMRDYLSFAWEKANGCRGISAMRSLLHMRAWLFLLGEDEAVGKIDDYTHYGKPILREITEWLGEDWTKFDDGKWRQSEFDEGISPDKVERLNLGLSTAS